MVQDTERAQKAIVSQVKKLQQEKSKLEWKTKAIFNL